ncbi:hypothetical protein [Hymenobacter actinosclerus]|uniref:Right handed beta helix region n=1 Tax=Hymenobacter actinosclerus TaxID=82805 RepID=A0A1I0J7M0_9BACT|nr:hypothetical protein [Hymenobacter actinosclerus]SEU05882.1 hypothetical protein SAMN04487998_3690 [Hymenobacter actinosclerus]
MIKQIFTLVELLAALNDPQPATLELQASILCPSSIILPAGFNIIGADKEKCMLSFSVGDGIGLTANNEISTITVQTNPGNRAIYVQGNSPDLGTITLKNLTVTGQVQILTRAGTINAQLVADTIDIVACDARRYSEQPLKYGVNVYQGAFTVYNYNSDENSLLNVTLTNISLGRKGAPVIGSGLFVGGFGDIGGRVLADTITTGDIYSNGMIPFGQPNRITGGVFILNGARVKNLVNQGTLTTYGVNDMVLDAWGHVEKWTAEKAITSYGPSGIGFVNFGVVDEFEAKEKIETFGGGARGFNQYDGTIGKATFHSIITNGDGSIGMQFSKPVGSITVLNSVVTHGSKGQTLVKGVISTLPADAISVKSGGEIRELTIAGGITTHGDNVHSYNVEGGVVKQLSVEGDITANGKSSVAVKVSDDGKTPLANISAKSTQGTAVQIAKGKITDRKGLTAKGAKGNIVEN